MKQKLLSLFLISFTYSLAFSQLVDGGTYPLLCPGGESITLTGTILGFPLDADDYCAQWVEFDGTHEVIGFGEMVTVSPTATTTYIFEVTFNNGDIETDEVTINVCTSTIHPVNADFQVSNKGKILIWSGSTDNNYWTTKKTTKADKPAQSKDHSVNVTVHLSPGPDMVGQTVYFRLVDPDLDDESNYESDSDPGDNKDAGVGAGTLSATSDVTTLEMIDGNSVAAAEVELTITDQYSGDDYQVEASLDPTFADPAQIMKTAKLVAWERVYVEQDNMLRAGATIIQPFTADADTSPDVIIVDNIDDFDTDTTIEIFDNAGGTIQRTVLAKGPNQLAVADLPSDIAQYAGVKIIGLEDTYQIETDLFVDGYGQHSMGKDDGTFVEFVWGHPGSGTVPKFTEFPVNNMFVIPFQYAKYWAQSAADKTNIFQLIAAKNSVGNTYGVSRINQNAAFVFNDQFAFANNSAAISETAVHEFGHLFNVQNGHIDDGTPAVQNHNGSDVCNMNYTRVRDNGIVEFDLDCIYDIRDEEVPR